MNILTKIIFYLIIIYIACFFALYLFQRTIMYRPNSVKPIMSDDIKNYFYEVEIQTSDNLSLLAWYAKSSKEYPTIIYFHGNAGDIGDRVDNLQPFVRQGFGLLLLSYRGYGGNQGKPSEDGFYQDARAAVKFLLNTKIVELSQIIFFGESIGTGVAVQMAAEYPTKMLILQSPYTSMAELAKTKYPIFPVEWLLTEHYDSIAKFPKLGQKIIIFHGSKDTVVPAYMSEKLYSVASNAELLIEPSSDHDDILTGSMAERIIKFINTVFSLN